MSAPAPLRVLRIIDRLNVGGPSKHVTWLSAGLDPDRFQTTLVTGSIAPGEGDMSWFARAAGVEPVSMPEMSRALRPADLLVTLRLWRLMRELRPQVVHTHKAKAGAVGRAAAWLYRWITPSTLVGKPRRCGVVHTFHGHVFHSYHGALATQAFLAIERVLARVVTDRIVTLSPQQRDEIVGRFGVGRADQVTVLPLGFELPGPPLAARGKLRAELGLGADELLIGAVGRLCEVKNHEMLLASVGQLVRDGLPVRLALVGDGHLRETLAACGTRHGLRGRLHFLGFRDDMPAVYGDLDVVALTSLNEGTPLTLLEAFACSRPVAATAVGGVVDILGARTKEHPGFTVWEHGVTAESRDADGFAAGLRHLLARPGLRADMGRAGRAFVRGKMGKARLVRDVEALYGELLDGRPAKRGAGPTVWGGDGNESADHGRRRVHRLAPRGALPRAR